MVNQVVLVGYIYSNDEIKQTLKFNGDCYIELDCNFQNNDGQYKRERFEVRLWRGIHDTLREYPNGSLICLKGRLENNDNNTIVVAEKITIIRKNTSKKVN
ncbi:MAG: single-stranded DNA-binding protein [Erysipelotrichia bacterium]|nr:single-stranded DNA-binding protein [Erysipelotrichia bacterium]